MSDPVLRSHGDTIELALKFDDNRQAQELFGEFDAHLAMLEERLGVEAVGRGNHLTLKGSPDACALARLVLGALQEQIAAGQTITPGDVAGAIRMATAAPSAFGSDASEKMRKPDDDRKPRENDGVGLKMATIRTRQRTITARTPGQDLYIRRLSRNDLVFAAGPAGTGKTYLAVAHATALLETGAVGRIVLSRPAIEAGERLGFLPGDMRDKVDPYLKPLYDALYDMMPADRVERGLETGVIEIAPLAFMRGRTLSHAAVILDEAQNATSMQMKMFLTRLGEDSRMMVTGDPSQTDLPAGEASGLAEAMRLLGSIAGVANVTFSDADVVRSDLVARIVKAYDHALKR